MDSDWLLAVATMLLSYTALGVVVSLYIRLGKLESALRAGRERSEAQMREWMERSDEELKEWQERSDEQLRDWRERSDARFREQSERSEAQFREWRERSDAQHQEVLKEIRRITDAPFPHSHEPDGSIIYRVPPPSGSSAAE